MNKKPLKKMPRGEGSMSYVTRGNTEYICYKKVIGDGSNKKRHAVYGSTQQECIKLMKEYETEFNNKLTLLNPAQDGNEKSLLSTSMQAWLYEKKFGTVKATSFDLLECVFLNHIKDSDIGRMQFSRVTAEDITEMLKAKKDAGYSMSTTNKIYSLFFQYFNFVYAKDKIKNPMFFVEKITVKDHMQSIVKDLDEDDYDIFDSIQNGIDINTSKKIMNDEEMDIFVQEAIIEHRNRHGGWRYGAGLVFIMFSFLRVGEAVALKWRDISFENKTVHIYKSVARVQDRSDSKNKEKWVLTTPKTESGTRINMLSDQAMSALQIHFNHMAKGRTYEEMQNNYVFETIYGTFADPVNLYTCVQKIMNKVGIDKSKAGMHKLRHTGISYYIRHGVPIDIIAKMAGHKSSRITREVYYGLIDDQFKEAVSIMNSIQSGKK